MIYWQEGLSLTYQGGSVIIESAVYESTSDKKVLPGILISVFTTSPNVSSLSVVGFLSDELDSAIQTIFPREFIFFIYVIIILFILVFMSLHVCAHMCVSMNIFGTSVGQWCTFACTSMCIKIEQDERKVK